MTSFTNLVETLEKLAFEILLWIVFIPKTLFKIIWSPSWVPKYIDEEMAKEKGKFSEYLPPLVLLIIIVVGMAGAIQWVYSSSGIEAVIPQTASVGEKTILYAKPKFLWSNDFAFSQWAIVNESGEVELVYTRYNFNMSDNPLKAVFTEYTDKLPIKLRDMISREEYYLPFSDASLISVNDRDHYRSPVSQLTYQWEKEGVYVVFVAFYGDFGGRQVSKVYRVYVSSTGTSQPPAFTDNNIGIVESSFGKDVISMVRSSVFQNREFTIFLILLVLIIPMIMALFSHVLQGGRLSRSGLQRHLYVHVMYISPLILSGLMLLFFTSSVFEIYLGGDEWQSFYIQDINRWTYGCLLFFLVFLAWFLVSEIKFFIRETSKSSFSFLLFICLIWLFARLYDYRLPARAPDFLSNDFSYYLYTIPSSIFYRLVPSLRLNLPYSFLGFSSYLPSKTIILFFYLLIGAFVLPPLGYIIHKFAPVFWDNSIQLIINRRQKGDYIQRSKRLIRNKLKLAKNNALLALILSIIFIVCYLIFESPDTDIFSAPYAFYFTVIGGVLLLSAYYLAVFYFGALLVCLVFALPEKMSNSMATLVGLVAGYGVTWLFTLFNTGAESPSSRFQYLIIAVICALSMSHFSWKLNKTINE